MDEWLQFLTQRIVNAGLLTAAFATLASGLPASASTSQAATALDRTTTSAPCTAEQLVLLSQICTALENGDASLAANDVAALAGELKHYCVAVTSLFLARGSCLTEKDCLYARQLLTGVALIATLLGDALIGVAEAEAETDAVAADGASSTSVASLLSAAALKPAIELLVAATPLPQGAADAASRLQAYVDSAASGSGAVQLSPASGANDTGAEDAAVPLVLPGYTVPQEAQPAGVRSALVRMMACLMSPAPHPTAHAEAGAADAVLRLGGILPLLNSCRMDSANPTQVRP
jgi:hypothetical protein